MTTSFVMFDVYKTPFDDIRIRQAFAHAVDKGTLANHIRAGYENPAVGGFVPPGHPGHSPDIGLPYDPDRARDLLVESDYPGGRYFPTIKVRWFNAAAQHYEFLREQWKQILGVEIATWEWAEHSTPKILIAGWGGGYPDPEYFLRNFLGTMFVVPEELYPDQQTRWRNADFDNLVETARRLMDQEKRMAMYRKADRILMEKAAVIPLTYFRSHLMLKPWIKKYPTSAINDTYWKDVIIEPH